MTTNELCCLVNSLAQCKTCRKCICDEHYTATTASSDGWIVCKKCGWMVCNVCRLKVSHTIQCIECGGYLEWVMGHYNVI